MLDRDSLRQELGKQTEVLDGALRSARNAWSSAGVSLMSMLGGGGNDSALHALNQIEQVSAKRWRGQGLRLADQAAPEQAEVDRWTEAGNAIIEAVNDIGGFSTESSIRRVLLDTFRASASEMGNTVVAVRGFVTANWRLMAIGAGVLVLGVIAWRVAK